MGRRIALGITLADFIPNARFFGGPCDGLERDIDLKGTNTVLIMLGDPGTATRGAQYVLQPDRTLQFVQMHDLDEFETVLRDWP